MALTFGVDFSPQTSPYKRITYHVAYILSQSKICGTKFESSIVAGRIWDAVLASLDQLAY